MSPLQYKIYQFIKNYLLEHGYSPTLSEVAAGIGISPRSKGLISRYVHKLLKTGWLMQDGRGYRNLHLPSLRLQLFVEGEIAAGSPVEPTAQQESLDLATILCEEGRYALTMKGNSMEKLGILDGDKIICRRQSVADTGNLAVVLLDGDANKTLRYVHHQDEGSIALRAASSAASKAKTYEPHEVTIEGVVVGLLRFPLDVPC